MDTEIKESELFLRNLPIDGGFKVSDGYFDELNKKLRNQEELDFIKEIGVNGGFKVEPNYFENLNKMVFSKINQPARLININLSTSLSWVTGLAASITLVLGLYFLQPSPPPSSLSQNNVEEEELFNQVVETELDVDFLCDAGWCKELEKINANGNKIDEEILFDTDEELIVNEL